MYKYNLPIDSKIFWMINVCIAVSLALCIIHFGMMQFEGYDGSILINSAWQLHLRYVPYVDIVTGWPPILLIGSQIAFTTLGVHWQSLIIVTAIFSAITYILQIGILQQSDLNPWISIIFTSTIQVITIVVISWWWYNQITTIIGILFSSTALLMIRKPDNRFGQAMFIISGTLLTLSKPNIAGMLLFMVGLILAYYYEARRRFIILTISVISLSGMILILFNINPIDLIKSYAIYGSQAISSQRIINFLWSNNPTESAATTLAIAPSIVG